MRVSLRVAGDTIEAKAPAAAVEQILPALWANKPELLTALAKSSKPAAVPAQAERSGHWLILQPERMERWFSPEVTRADSNGQSIIWACPACRSTHRTKVRWAGNSDAHSLEAGNEGALD